MTFADKLWPMRHHVRVCSLLAAVFVLFNLNWLNRAVMAPTVSAILFRARVHNSPPDTRPRAPTIHHPPPLSQIFRPHNRPSHKTPFSTPRIIAAHTRPRAHPDHLHDLFVYSTGVALHNDTRKLTVLACVVGHTAHPAAYAFQDGWAPYGVTRCLLPTKPPPDAPISLLLLHDARLRDALSDTNRSVLVMPVAVPPASIVDPPPALTIRPAMDIEDDDDDVRAIRHAATNRPVKMVASDVTLASFPVDAPPVTEMGMSGNPRYRVCLATQIRSYTYALPDWVDYHRALGVDKVFIADNDADQDVAAMFAQRADVEVVHWPFDRAQFQSLSYLVQAGRSRCEWVMVADVDEYVMLGREGVPEKERPLGMYANALMTRHKEQVLMPYVQMAGKRLVPATEPLALAYTTLEVEQHEDQGKSMCSGDVEWERHAMHRCIAQSRWNDDVNEWSKAARQPSHVSEGGRLVHFHYRSWSEYQMKKKMGSASLLKLERAPVSEVASDPPKWWYEMGGEEWTFFRDRWTQVLDEHSKTMQTMVWIRSGGNGRKRCVRHLEPGQGWIGGAVCSNL